MIDAQQGLEQQQSKKLNTCLKHLLGWVALTAATNLFSLWRIHNGDVPLTATEPFGALVFCLAYLPTIYLGYRGFKRLFILSTLLYIQLIAYGGIVRHLLAAVTPGGLEGYASLTGVLIVAAINIYGTVGFGLAIYYAVKKVPDISASDG